MGLEGKFKKHPHQGIVCFFLGSAVGLPISTFFFEFESLFLSVLDHRRTIFQIALCPLH